MRMEGVAMCMEGVAMCMEGVTTCMVGVTTRMEGKVKAGQSRKQQSCLAPSFIIGPPPTLTAKPSLNPHHPHLLPKPSPPSFTALHYLQNQAHEHS